MHLTCLSINTLVRMSMIYRCISSLSPMYAIPSSESYFPNTHKTLKGSCLWSLCHCSCAWTKYSLIYSTLSKNPPCRVDIDGTPYQCQKMLHWKDLQCLKLIVFTLFFQYRCHTSTKLHGDRYRDKYKYQRYLKGWYFAVVWSVGTFSRVDV